MALFVLLVAASGVDAAFPKPTGHVNDFAGVIPAQTEAQMEALCRELKTKTGAEIAVATFKDLGGEDYNEFANKLFAAWGVGGKKDDSGVLILLALKERKMRIETGYGNEGDLPDALCGRIRDEYMLPRFRTGDYAGGLYAGTAVAAQIIAKANNVTLTGAPAVRHSTRSRRSAGPQGGTFGQKVMGVLFVMFMIYMFIKHPRMMILMLLMSGRGGRGGGSWGGGGGGFGGGFGGFGGGSSGGGGAGGGW